MKFTSRCCMSLAFYGEKHHMAQESLATQVVCHLHFTVRNTGYDLTYLLVVTCRVVLTLSSRQYNLPNSPGGLFSQAFFRWLNG